MALKEAYVQAKYKYKKKQYDESIEILTSKVLPSNPHHANGLQLLGLNKLQKGLYEEARINVLEAIRLRPSSSPYYLSLGMCYLTKARAHIANKSICTYNIKEAKRNFEMIKSKDINCISAFLGLKECYLIEKEYNAAIAILNSAVQVCSTISSKKCEGNDLDTESMKTDNFEGETMTPDKYLIEIFYQLGKIHRKNKNFSESYNCFQKVLNLNPDHEMAKYWLAVVKVNVFGLHVDDNKNDQPKAAPTIYISTLYDGYAKTFENHITNDLQYRTPEVLINYTISKSGQNRFENILDLGCGTGLSGDKLVNFTSGALVGIDLSPNMIAVAAKKNIYSSLITGDMLKVVNDLRSVKNPFNFDLIFAADVVVYMGDLRPLLNEVKNLCNSCKKIREEINPAIPEKDRSWSHIFAFSTEAALNSTDEEEGISYILQDTARYCHSKSYLKTVANEVGWEVIDQIETTFIRTNGDKKLLGHLVVLGLPKKTGPSN